jgi:hypothetical protein
VTSSDPPAPSSVTDRRGHAVTVGSRVRVLAIPPSWAHTLPPEEWADLQTMVGEAFDVYEIDEWGQGVGREMVG